MTITRNFTNVLANALNVDESKPLSCSYDDIPIHEGKLHRLCQEKVLEAKVKFRFLFKTNLYVSTFNIDDYR